jgi:Pentapeptide repeats (8 copies)
MSNPRRPMQIRLLVELVLLALTNAVAIYVVMREQPKIGRLSIVLAAIAFVVIARFLLLVLPISIVNWSISQRSIQQFPEGDRLKAENDVRTSLLQVAAWVLLLGGLFATWSQVQVSRQGQITDRFSKALDQIGHPKDANTRLGGIFALERIAKESEQDRVSIAQIIASFARAHAHWKGTPRSGKSPCPARQEYKDIASESIMEVRSPDVQGAITVLGREPLAEDTPAFLHEINTPLADFNDAHFKKARFRGANLLSARMVDAHFEGALFDTEDGGYCNAHLELIIARRVSFQDANLEGAYLYQANLRDANLSRTDLRNADLREADLTGAILKDAVANKNTKWPDGFDPQSHGVKMEEG